MHAFQSAASKNGDNKIDAKEAGVLVNKIKELATPGQEYPQGRKHIVAYARLMYEWTPEADSEFRINIRNWSTERRAAQKAAAAEVAPAHLR